MHLQLFPFDKNVIEINVGPEYYNMKHINLIVNVAEQEKINDINHRKTTSSSVDTKAINNNLEEWDVSANTRTYVMIKAGRSFDVQNINHSFDIIRRSSFYLYKIMLVEILITIWSWTVFFLPSDEMTDRYSITLALF